MSRRDEAEALDARDPVASARALFALPEGVLYLDGNSLGPPAAGAASRVEAAVRAEWGEGLVSSWNAAGWWEEPIRLGDRIARLVGAAPGQVAVCDSTSVNLYKVLASALRLAAGRRVVVAERECFPTDRYMLEGLSSVPGALHVRLVGHAPGDLVDGCDESVGAVLVNHVDYRTARRVDLGAVVARAHDVGALVVADVAHSAGAIEVALDDWGVDFAVGCTYKYLNGGPGSPAFVYVASRHLTAATQPLSGWHGHERPFAFTDRYAPAPGIRRFLCGSPPIVAYAALDAALDVWDSVDLRAVVAKGQDLVDLLLDLLDERCPELTVASPRARPERGSHVALRHEGAYDVVRALAARGVLADFREPDVVRVGLAPLYLRFVDVVDAVSVLRDVLDDRPWERAPTGDRATVT
ncbi:MAG: kynureninase [Actinomycetota bacterium]|nr:kynureninase [Actinomycetota bacterium]